MAFAILSFSQIWQSVLVLERGARVEPLPGGAAPTLPLLNPFGTAIAYSDFEKRRQELEARSQKPEARNGGAELVSLFS